MSPMVPPSSMMHTSGFLPSELTGMADTRSTQLWIASVMWGTTWKFLFALVNDQKFTNLHEVQKHYLAFKLRQITVIYLLIF